MCELASLGLIAKIGGGIVSGVSGFAQSRNQARQIEEQAATEQVLNGIEDVRLRDKMRAQIGKQRLQLAGRGVSMDSPAALALGQQAASELSYASQSVRSHGAARQAELKAGARASRAQGTMALLKGGFSAAGSFLDGAPDVWPGLFGEGEAA